MAFLEPCDIFDHGRPARFDPAMIAIDGLVLADRRVREAIGLLFGHEHLDVVAQRALVSFECEHVIGFLADDLRSDVALYPFTSPSGLFSSGR